MSVSGPLYAAPPALVRLDRELDDLYGEFAGGVEYWPGLAALTGPFRTLAAITGPFLIPAAAIMGPLWLMEGGGGGGGRLVT